jgi:DNA modification methylase
MLDRLCAGGTGEAGRDRLGPYLLGPNDENQGIYTGDAKELAPAIPDGSVDLIFTDPVYQNIDDYCWLAETAARVLKPGKSCMALAGNMEKPELYRVMGEHLTYFWEGAILYRGDNFFMNSLHVQVSWKPVLWFMKGDRREAAWCKDALVDTGKEKRYHRWQQSPTPAVWYVRQLTGEGDVVLDPFCGWGTYPAACKMLGRRWLGFEIVSERAQEARDRITSMNAVQWPLFVPQAQQARMEGI